MYVIKLLAYIFEGRFTLKIKFIHPVKLVSKFRRYKFIFCCGPLLCVQMCQFILLFISSNVPYTHSFISSKLYDLFTVSVME
jgi:hypothetical protein